MKVYKSEVPFGNDKRTVVMMNLEAPQPSVRPTRLHHIFLIDQSHSMSSEIDRLIDQVRIAIQNIHERDGISIIGFSSPDSCKVFLEDVRKNDGIYDVLESMKSASGDTCFSVPLEKTKELMEKRPGRYAITLFTDGYPSTPWPVEREEERIFQTLDQIKDKVVAIDTVGYGNYYNQDLLWAMSAKSEYGMFIHSRRVTDFSTIFGHNYERMAELDDGIIDVDAADVEILYLTDRNVKLAKGRLKLNMVSKRKNQLFLIGNGEFSFTCNGQTYHTNRLQVRNIRRDTIRNMHYAYAYSTYYMGMRHMSLEILVKNLGDKALVDSHLYSFTYDEVSKHVEKLRKATFMNDSRYGRGVCSADYMPEDDHPCVMDVLMILSGSRKNYYIPLPYKEYHRIGKKVVDADSIILNEDEPRDDDRSPFVDLVFHKDRLNVSIRHFIKRTAQLDLDLARRENLPDKLEVTLVRHQAIIKDGNLNVPRIEALIDEDTARKLTNRPIYFEVLGNDVSGLLHVRIPLEDLPIINRTYVNKDISDVLKTVRDLLYLEAEHRVLQHLIQRMKDGMKLQSPFPRRFTSRQLQVLRQHGIDHKLHYVGRNNVKVELKESYRARSLQFYIKGYSHVPKVEEVCAKIEKGKPLRDVERYMMNYMDSIRSRLQGETALDALYDRLYDVKKEINGKRMEIRCIKLAKIVTGDWFEGAEPDGKGNFTYREGGDTLVIRPIKETIYI